MRALPEKPAMLALAPMRAATYSDDRELLLSTAGLGRSYGTTNHLREPCPRFLQTSVSPVRSSILDTLYSARAAVILG